MAWIHPLQAAAGVSAQLAATAAEVMRLQAVGTTATSAATSAASTTAALRLLARAAAPALQRCNTLQAYCAVLSTLVLPRAGAGSAKQQCVTAAATLLHELQELAGAMGISTATSTSSSNGSASSSRSGGAAGVQLQSKWSLRAVVVSVLACNRLQRLLDSSNSSGAQRPHHRTSKRSNSSNSSSSRQRATTALQLLPDSALSERIDSDALAAAVSAATAHSRFADDGYSGESQTVFQVLDVLLSDSRTAAPAAAESPFSGYCSDGFNGNGNSSSSRKRTTGYKSSSSSSTKSLLTCLAKGLTQHHARLAKRGIAVQHGSGSTSSSIVVAALPLVTAVRAGFVKLARRVSALEVCCHTS
jgi:hypothetical protein